MEEMGFSIAVPETMLCGFAIMVVLAFVILIKVLKIAKQVDDIYSEMDEVNDRLKRIESFIERK